MTAETRKDRMPCQLVQIAKHEFDAKGFYFICACGGSGSVKATRSAALTAWQGHRDGRLATDEWRRAQAHALALVVALAPFAKLWTDRLAHLAKGDDTEVYGNYGNAQGGVITVGHIREAKRLVDLVLEGKVNGD